MSRFATAARVAIACAALAGACRPKSTASSDAGAGASSAAPAPASSQVIEKHRAKVKPLADQRFDLMHKLPPRVFSDTLHAPDNGPLVIGGATSNAPLLYEVGGKSEGLSHRIEDDAGKALEDCYKLLHDGNIEHDYGKPVVPSAAETEQILSRCESFKYMLIVRVWSTTDPNMSGYQTFTPGKVEGDVLVFNIQTSKSLGGIHFKAANTENIKAVTGSENETFNRDLRANAARAITDAIRKRVPTATIAL